MKWFKKRPSKEEHREDNRMTLIQQRGEIEIVIAHVEEQESFTLRQGKMATSNLAKRRLAAQLSQLRKDINRHRQTVTVLNHQINIQATDLHNKTIINTAKAAQLPSADELTEHAVAAEQILETITTDAEMVSGFEVNHSQFLVSDEEEAIMREFEDAETKDEPEPEPECESLYTDKYPVNRDATSRQAQKE